MEAVHYIRIRESWEMLMIKEDIHKKKFSPIISVV